MRFPRTSIQIITLCGVLAAGVAVAQQATISSLRPTPPTQDETPPPMRPAIDASLREVRRPLAVSLIVLGLGLAVASVIQVAIGLRSLDRIGQDLRRVRAGKTDRLPRPDVRELRPLAAEINAAHDTIRRHEGRG